MSELSGTDLDAALEAAFRARYPPAHADGMWLMRSSYGLDTLCGVARREGYGVELYWPPESGRDGCRAALWRGGVARIEWGDCAGEALARALLTVWGEEEKERALEVEA